MRQNLGQRSTLVLRRLLLSPGSRLRLRLAEENRTPRQSLRPRLQHVALLRTSPSTRRFRSEKCGRWHSARRIAEARREVGLEESLFQKRRRLLPFSFFQGPRRGHGTRRRAPI